MPPEIHATSSTRTYYIASREDTAFFGHPRALSVVFFTEMWERFSYYGIRPLLVLFMSTAILDGGFGLSRPEAAAIVGIYASCVFLVTLPGGMLADRWLGARRAVYSGAVFITLGHLCIGLSAALSKPAFFLGLILIVIGSGLLKPAMSSMVGAMYADHDTRRESGYSIFYMSVNLGSIGGQFIAGYLGERVGWHWGFGAAGIGMLLGLITYHLRAPKLLKGIGEAPARPSLNPQAARARNAAVLVLGVTALIFLAVTTGLIHVNPVLVASWMGYLIAVSTLAYLGYLLIFEPLDKQQRCNVLIIGLLFVLSAAFWAAFEQAPTSLNLFAKDYVDRDLLGFEIPATWYQSANPIFVVLLAPLFAVLWLRLQRAGILPSSVSKFAVALLLAAAGFYLLVVASSQVLGGGKVSPMWLIGSYLLQTLGELCLSPVGLAAVSRLAPKHLVTQMMGVFFMGAALGNLIAGLFGGHVEAQDAAATMQTFSQTTTMLLATAALAAVLIIPARRLMGRAGSDNNA